LWVCFKKAINLLFWSPNDVVVVKYLQFVALGGMKIYLGKEKFKFSHQQFFHLNKDFPIGSVAITREEGICEINSKTSMAGRHRLAVL
jgi:hypothetical protein